jgi:hypothetical protein
MKEYYHNKTYYYQNEFHERTSVTIADDPLVRKGVVVEVTTDEKHI